MLKTLLVLGTEGHNFEENAQFLIDYMADTGLIEVATTTNADALAQPDGFDVIVAYKPGDQLTPAQEAGLLDFVRRGGGFVGIHCAAEAGQNSEAYHRMLGCRTVDHGPVTELVANRANGDHFVTRRLDGGFTVVDEFSHLEKTVDDCDVLFETSWRFRDYPLAYARDYGDGKVFYTSLGHGEETFRHPVFQQMIFRATRYVTGIEESAEPIGVAVIGYGPASGMGYLHGTAVESVAGLRFVAACDRDEERLAAATRDFTGIRTYADAAQLAEDPGVGLVFIATPPDSHAPIARQMLQAGKHVVAEKPFCLTTSEADELIALAEERDLVVSVYQNRRWDGDFLAIQRALAEGLIGEPFYVEAFVGGYEHPCDLWHSHQPISGGAAYDWGAHYIDWLLTLMPGDLQYVIGAGHKRVWHDVTNADQLRVQLRFEDGREAAFIDSYVAAIRKPKWYILGTEGAIVGQWRHESVKSTDWSGNLVERHLRPSESPSRLTARVRDSFGDLVEQTLPQPDPPPYPFHRNLADHLLSGEPLAVTPESARRVVAVIEAAQESAENDARPTPIR